MYQQNMDQLPRPPGSPSPANDYVEDGWNDVPPPPENGYPPPPGNGYVKDGWRPESNFRGLSNIEKRKKEDNIVKNGVLDLILRACALVFSFISFILVVVLPYFHEERRSSYVFSIALITTVYSAIQLGIKGDNLRTGQEAIPQNIAVWFDFIGDQVVAYMLMSSASVGALVTSAFAPGESQTMDKAAASVAMLFLAFFCVAPSAAISSYHLFAGLPSPAVSSVRPTDRNF